MFQTLGVVAWVVAGPVCGWPPWGVREAGKLVLAYFFYNPKYFDASHHEPKVGGQIDNPRNFTHGAFSGVQ